MIDCTSPLAFLYFGNPENAHLFTTSFTSGHLYRFPAFTHEYISVCPVLLICSYSGLPV